MLDNRLIFTEVFFSLQPNSGSISTVIESGLKPLRRISASRRLDTHPDCEFLHHSQ